jgi:hypothetical protein
MAGDGVRQSSRTILARGFPERRPQILAARFKKSGPTIAHQKQGRRPRIYTFWIKHDFYCCITDKLLIQNLIELI